MPYFAPDAPMPMTSCAPRLAERNASPVTHGGSDRPDTRKSVDVRIRRRSAQPMPRTAAKYTAMVT